MPEWPLSFEDEALDRDLFGHQGLGMDDLGDLATQTTCDDAAAREESTEGVHSVGLSLRSAAHNSHQLKRTAHVWCQRCGRCAVSRLELVYYGRAEGAPKAHTLHGLGACRTEDTP